MSDASTAHAEHVEIYRRIAALETRAALLEQRLDGLANTIEATVQLPLTVAKWEGTIESLNDDIGYLRRKVEAREEERKQERLERERNRKADAKVAREEKRSDRRWIVGTILTAAGLIVAAIGLLANAGVL
jgi:uncharacterized coiled-coil protein SlyX